MASWITEEQRKQMEDDFKDLELKNKDKMGDSMIRASNKAGLTRNQLFDTLFEEGVLAVYNLGLKHMYEYLE